MGEKKAPWVTGQFRESRSWKIAQSLNQSINRTNVQRRYIKELKKKTETYKLLRDEYRSQSFLAKFQKTNKQRIPKKSNHNYYQFMDRADLRGKVSIGTIIFQDYLRIRAHSNHEESQRERKQYREMAANENICIRIPGAIYFHSTNASIAISLLTS